MPRKRPVGLLVGGLGLAAAVLGLIFSAFAVLHITRDNNDHLHEPTAAVASPLRILCYGDSLTLGLSPPLHIDPDSYCPYSDSLRIALDKLLGPQKASVQHIGLSGWTSSQFLKHAKHNQRGLAVHAADTDVTIILIGSNDISRVLRNTQDNVEKAANFISRNLWTLHEVALQAGARRTLVLSIPESRYHQGRAKLLVQEVNRKLEERVKQSGSTKTIYAGFPVEPKVEDYWSSDGLHLSCLGYQRLGKALASVVADHLKDELS